MAMMAFPFSAAFPKPMPVPTASAVLLRPKLTHPVPSQPKSFPGAGIIRPRVVFRASSGDRQDVGEIEHPKTASEEPKSEEASNDMGSEVTRKGLKEGGGDLWWGGVTEEIGEIEWPAFGKVVGTTGVVLGVIAGSSVVLLTVNAVLAELSDRVFAGRGIQDFFG